MGHLVKKLFRHHPDIGLGHLLHGTAVHLDVLFKAQLFKKGKESFRLWFWHHKAIGLEGEVRIHLDGHQIPAQEGEISVGDEVLFLLLLGDGLNLFVEPFQGAEGVDEIRCGLLADAGNAGDVVRGVPGEGHDIHHLLGPDAQLLFDGIAVEVDVSGGV